MTTFPASRMSFFDALLWAERGYRIRRAIWRLTDALPFQIAGPNDLDLVWIYGEPSGERPGVYYYQGAAVGIVTNSKLTSADMIAADWTCDMVDTGNQSGDPALTNPNEGRPGVAGGGSGGSGAGADGVGEGGGGGAGGSGGGTFSGLGAGGGSGGGGSGGGGSGGAGDGGGGGGGGGGGNLRGAPNIILNVDNLSSPGAIPNLAGNPPVFDTTNKTDVFGCYIYINDPWAKPGELWFVTATHGTPSGFVNHYHGTLAPNTWLDAGFSITAQPAAENTFQETYDGAYEFSTIERYKATSTAGPNITVPIPGSGPFGVQVTAFLPFKGINAAASATVKMRPHEPWCPINQVWVHSGNACFIE